MTPQQAWVSLRNNTKDSLPLKEWVRRNKDQKYVPTDLLKDWGLEDDLA
jgi:hypothetical protein